MPSFVTCISLLLTDGLERTVFQPLELELQMLEVHDGLPSEVLPLPLLEPLDSKHRRSPSVRPSDFDRLKLPSPHEHIGPEEEVIGLDQSSTSFFREPAPASDSVPRDEALRGWNGRRSTTVRTRG
jgi:hypothetical protein